VAFNMALVPIAGQVKRGVKRIQAVEEKLEGCEYQSACI